MKVGDKFRLFQKGVTCKVVSLTNSKVRFETTSGMSGSFPLARVEEHIPSDIVSHKTTSSVKKKA